MTSTAKWLDYRRVAGRRAPVQELHKFRVWSGLMPARRALEQVERGAG